jgi:hypothetical protein
MLVTNRWYKIIHTDKENESDVITLDPYIVSGHKRLLSEIYQRVLASWTLLLWHMDSGNVNPL